MNVIIKDKFVEPTTTAPLPVVDHVTPVINDLKARGIDPHSVAWDSATDTYTVYLKEVADGAKIATINARIAAVAGAL